MFVIHLLLHKISERLQNFILFLRNEGDYGSGIWCYNSKCSSWWWWQNQTNWYNFSSYSNSKSLISNFSIYFLHAFLMLGFYNLLVIWFLPTRKSCTFFLSLYSIHNKVCTWSTFDQIQIKFCLYFFFLIYKFLLVMEKKISIYKLNIHHV